MYKHILIPIDGSKLSEKAIKDGVKLAKAIGARVTGFMATPTFLPVIAVDPVMTAYPLEDYRKDSEKHAKKSLDVLKRAAAAAGVRCTVEHLQSDQPWNAIIRAVRRNRCDLIFMASHGRRGIAGFVLGSETTKVLTHSKTPVLVCR